MTETTQLIKKGKKVAFDGRRLTAGIMTEGDRKKNCSTVR